MQRFLRKLRSFGASLLFSTGLALAGPVAPSVPANLPADPVVASVSVKDTIEQNAVLHNKKNSNSEPFVVISTFTERFPETTLQISKLGQKLSTIEPVVGKLREGLSKLPALHSDVRVALIKSPPRKSQARKSQTRTSAARKNLAHQVSIKKRVEANLKDRCDNTLQPGRAPAAGACKVTDFDELNKSQAMGVLSFDDSKRLFTGADLFVSRILMPNSFKWYNNFSPQAGDKEGDGGPAALLLYTNKCQRVVEAAEYPVATARLSPVIIKQCFVAGQPGVLKVDNSLATASFMQVRFGLPSIQKPLVSANPSTPSPLGNVVSMHGLPSAGLNVGYMPVAILADSRVAAVSGVLPAKLIIDNI